jgi:DNA topoisomerase IA
VVQYDLIYRKWKGKSEVQKSVIFLKNQTWILIAEVSEKADEKDRGPPFSTSDLQH